MIKYAWLIGSLMFFLIWCLIFFIKNDYRKDMLLLSLLTSLLGLTEPLFIPTYWHPLSLFDLAQRTGFDIESLIFTFSIGGIGAFLYNTVFGVKIEPLSETEVNKKRHQWHYFILLTPVVVFIGLAFITTLNHIYCGIIAMTTGALTALYCRPDLKVKIIMGGILFSTLYFVFFSALIFFFQDFVQKTWNMPALSNILIFQIPLEELLFAFSFGMLWSSLYEHCYWLKDVKK